MSYEKYLQKAPSYRTKRVAEQVKQAIGQELTQLFLNNPTYEEVFATITHIEVAPDLKTAKIYLSLSNLGEISEDEVLEYLNASKKYFRSVISKKLSIKSTPVVNFLVDNDQKRVEHLEALFRSLN